MLFKEKPENTHYAAGSYSWVHTPTARGLIAGGYGVEYDPDKGKEVEPDFPTMDDTKEDIQQYLYDNEIDYNKSDTKEELLKRIN